MLHRGEVGGEEAVRVARRPCFEKFDYQGISQRAGGGAVAGEIYVIKEVVLQMGEI